MSLGLRFGILAAALLAAAGLAQEARAATLVVDPVEGPYLDISSALRAASPGDEIVVAPGTYAGPVDLAYDDPSLGEGAGAFPVPPVALRSRDGAAATAIDAGGADFVVRLQPGCVLDGFTLVGSGDGVRVIGEAEEGEVTEIVHNEVEVTGAYGVRALGDGAVRVVANAIRGPSTAGVSARGEAEVLANLITGVDGAAVELADGAGAARNNQICHCGTGVRAEEGFTGEIVNNGIVFADVGADIRAGAAPASVRMNVVAWSEAGIRCDGAAPSAFGYNDFWELAGQASCAPAETDLAEDPAFVSIQAEAGTCGGLDMRLMPRSRLIDAGDPDVGDPDGTRADVGAFGGPDAALWDLDGDGSPWGQDCDDRERRAHPGAAEACEDGVDNDCDGWPDDPGTECFVDDEGLYCGAAGRAGPGGLALALALAGLALRRLRRRAGTSGLGGALPLALLLLLASPAEARQAEPPAQAAASARSAPVPQSGAHGAARAPRFALSVRGGYFRLGLSSFGGADVAAWGTLGRLPIQAGGGFLAAWRRDDAGRLRWVPLGRAGVGVGLDRGPVVPVVRGVVLLGAWDPERTRPSVGGGGELVVQIRRDLSRPPAIEVGGVAGVMDGKLVFFGTGGLALLF